jgi:hypothetical protein
MHHDRELAVSAAWVWLAKAPMLLNRLANRFRFRLHPVGTVRTSYPHFSTAENEALLILATANNAPIAILLGIRNRNFEFLLSIIRILWL